MKFFLIISLVLPLLFSCSKKKEKASKMSGTWVVTETKITDYVNNEPSSEELIAQSGTMVLDVTGTDDNEVRHNIPIMPCDEFSFWDIPKRKADQVYFYYYDANYVLVTSSATIEKLTKNELILLQVSYDSNLNILKSGRWIFRRAKLK